MSFNDYCEDMDEMESFVELIIKRTCRRAAYEFETHRRDGIGDTKNIYSPEFLKALYDNPMDNINTLIGMVNGEPNITLNKLNNIKENSIEQRYFIDFLNKISEIETKQFKEWSEFGHFMLYVYRNFISDNPSTKSELLSSNFIAQMKHLVTNLIVDDESQLLFRIYSLLRDYCMKAHTRFSKSCEDGQISITRMFYFYEALLAAARSVTAVFPEIERILTKNYSFSWIDFNTCVFIHYFFETSFIQSRIFDLNRNNFSPNDTPAMIGLLADLKNIWYREQGRVTQINDSAVLQANSPFLDVENYTISQNKKLFTSDFWINRAKEEKDSMCTNRLDHHIFYVIGDEKIEFAQPIVDDNGCCSCEECLVTKYKTIAETDSTYDQVLKDKLISCHRCHQLLALDYFAAHIPDLCCGAPSLNVIESNAADLEPLEGDLPFCDDVVPFYSSLSMFSPFDPEASNEPPILHDFKLEETECREYMTVLNNINFDATSNDEKMNNNYDIPSKFDCAEEVLQNNFNNSVTFDQIQPTLPLTKSEIAQLMQSKSLELCNGFTNSADILASEINDLSIDNSSNDDIVKCLDDLTINSQTFLNVLSNITLDTNEDFNESLTGSDNISDADTVRIPTDEDFLEQSESSGDDRMSLENDLNSKEPIETNKIQKERPWNKTGLEQKPATVITKENTLPPPSKQINESLLNNASAACADMERTKAAFAEFLKHRKDMVTSKGDQVLSKSVRNFIKIKKDIFNHPSGSFGGKVYDNVFKHTAVNSTTSPAKSRGDMTKESLTRAADNFLQKSEPGKIGQCEHNCSKHETPEEIKAEFKKAMCQARTACDHHKEKKCDCKYCGVFGTSVTSHSHKNNELRDRLRIRLHQRREKRTKDSAIHKSINNSTASTGSTNTSTSNLTAKVKIGMSGNNKIEERVPPTTQTAPAVPPASTKLPEKPITNDIHGLINYIEGNSTTDKVALAEKKAAKKARQRIKKEEERLKLEEEEKRKEREAKLLEQQKRKAEAMAKQLAEKALNSSKDSKKKKNKNKPQDKPEVIEETIPAMVTIKRIIENGTIAPTVTVTLKGSNPDQEKLFYTLVKATDDKKNDNNNKVKNKNQKTENVQQKTTTTANVTNKNKKKNKSEEPNNALPVNGHIIAKDLKVTLALDPGNSSNDSKKRKKQAEQNKKNTSAASTKSQDNNKKEIKKEENINLPIRLPPGITITKVDGPMSNRNLKSSSLQDQPQGSTINVSKSGVIVVDTEKLIQQTNGPANTNSGSKSKKNRKKKNKKTDTALPSSTVSPAAPSNGQQMITLKNPIFQSMQNNKPPEPVDRSMDSQCAPAAIFTSANGMVTIRRSRLQQSVNGSGITGMPIPSVLSDLKPIVGPDVPSTYTPPYNQPEAKRMSTFNAQEILSGLPGIEITKVDKRSNKSEETNKSCQTAQVSIIPTNNENSKFNLDKDDWTYDSVFTPKDILEDDMDADERELEAFKRFCQQSVPPERKEKVAHLNVKDIVFKKKNDANSF